MILVSVMWIQRVPEFMNWSKLICREPDVLRFQRLGLTWDRCETKDQRRWRTGTDVGWGNLQIWAQFGSNILCYLGKYRKQKSGPEGKVTRCGVKPAPCMGCRFTNQAICWPIWVQSWPVFSRECLVCFCGLLLICGGYLSKYLSANAFSLLYMDHCAIKCH